MFSNKFEKSSLVVFNFDVNYLLFKAFDAGLDGISASEFDESVVGENVELLV